MMLSMYFIIFLITVSAVDSLGITGSDGETTDDVDISTLEPQINEFCSDPRVAWSADGSVYEIREAETDCQQSIGVISEDRCNALQGCEWRNETTYILFFSSVTEGCFGDINISYYNDGNSDYESVCELSEPYENRNTCLQLGCTWNRATEDDLSQISNPRSILNILGELFSFRYDFGFSGLINTFVNLMLFYIPFIILAISIYFMLPFAH